MITPKEINVSVKFKCIHTGQVYEFTTEHDIKTMRNHSEYVEVKEEEEPVKAVKPKKGIIKE